MKVLCLSGRYGEITKFCRISIFIKFGSGTRLNSWRVKHSHVTKLSINTCTYTIAYLFREKVVVSVHPEFQLSAMGA